MINSWISLAANVKNAFVFSPPDYLRSILGDDAIRNSRYGEYSELQQVSFRNFPDNLETLEKILIFGWPGAPDWLPEKINQLGCVRNSRVLPFPVNTAQQTNFVDESWMFINGICTDKSILYLNAQYLFELFGRPLTLLHNQTHGWLPDLLECGLGKGLGIVTEAVRALFPAFYSELKRPDINRVVLIAHSQGTILAAVFLSLLRKLLGQEPQMPPSIEQQHADRLLSRKPENWGKENTRIMNPQGGIAGCDLVRCSRTQLLDNYIEAWLDWGDDVILGLPRLTKKELRKLEIFNFSTCATDLAYIDNDNQPFPYIEHFGNEKDLVARMGLYAPPSGLGATNMSGQIFTADDAWGHLLNTHYLSALETQWRDQREHFRPRFGNLVQESRLKRDYDSVSHADR